MRKFSSYGTVDTDLHYYVPREALIEQAYTQLVGENPNKGGHYMTVWAPRQRGKSWVMQKTLQQLRLDSRFDTLMFNLEDLRDETDVNQIVRLIAADIIKELELEEVRISNPLGTRGGLLGSALNLLSYLPIRVRPQLSNFFASASLSQFHRLFSKEILNKPLILILDEFDALSEEAISALASVFRKIYLSRQYQEDKPSTEKKYLLHGVALIGVEARLGIENKRGSPFNVQRSLHIPNLNFAEVEEMYQWYERESGQEVSEAVIKRVHYETQGQPGFVSWFGELLTETYNEHNPVITSQDFEFAYSAAVDALPNANIQNLISKASQAPYQQLVLEMFQTKEKIPRAVDNSDTNFLYTHYVVDQEVVKSSQEIHRYLKFPCPFVQKRLFNYFSSTLFRYVGELHEPFEDLSEIISDNHLNIKKLMALYERYLRQNREWLFRDVPRRTTDPSYVRTSLRIFEAVYHFNLYMYLSSASKPRGGQVIPEFPTGNGQTCPDVGRISLVIKVAGQKYGIEVKSYANQTAYKKAIRQAADYGESLELDYISLIFFVEVIDDANRQKYEVTTVDAKTGVSVEVVFVATS